MKKVNKILVILSVIVFMLWIPMIVRAETTVNLGSVDNFAVIAGSTITNTGSSVINGDIGLSPGTSVTGFPPGIINGTQHIANSVASQAQIDLAIAYNIISELTSVSTNTQLGGTTKTAGIYNSSDGTFDITGDLTLDAQGDQNAVFIFKAATTLITAGNSNVILVNGAKSYNVFWQVGSSATLGTNTVFKGNIIALTSITLNTGASVEGRVLARNGAVTLDTNTVTKVKNLTNSATLHVIKNVINDNGGISTASNFTINVSGTTNISPNSFTGSETGVDVTLDSGTYMVTETGPSGYLKSSSSDCVGTISIGETRTCIITNDDIAPQLIVNKIVVNDNGGTQEISDFKLFVDKSSVISGITNTASVGLHIISETPDSNYETTIGGNCSTNGTITLDIGDVKTCTITNDDIDHIVILPLSSKGSSYYPIPPLIDVVKVPTPLALPNGPGEVKYTYTLRNVGTVPVTNITMVGDTCSPIILVSGDTNSDNKLDINEKWIYNCSTTLSKTHTNIVTATGWANGISTNDIASSTVIVGLKVVPPLIHVTKVPNQLLLNAKGGMVTYLEKVTNPGAVALSNIHLKDDKCSNVRYILGDKNHNLKLDTSETWRYLCSTNISKTTTNTAIASGEANGLTVTDFAIATVVVASKLPVIHKLPIIPKTTIIPKLPNTGIKPD